MEKTTHILIGNVRFDITDDAFAVLDAYLKSLKQRFAHDDDAAEILRDIEARIAEKFLDTGLTLITLPVTQTMIAEIGSAEDMGTDEPAIAPDSEIRKLYRNPDDRLIAGVSSGIAAYIGIDPLIVRILFIFLVLAGGSGILLYILMWLLVPMAKTASQKLEMRGSAVTVGSLEQMVKDRGAGIVKSGAIQRIIYFPFALIGSVLRSIGSMAPAIGKIVGICVMIGTFFAILGVTVGAALAAANLDSSYLDFPLLAAVPHLQLLALILAAYGSALIPLLFIFLLGMRLMRARYHITPAIGFGLLGTWFIALIASALLTVSTVGQYQQYMKTAPEYQQVTTAVPVATFDEVHVIGSVPVKIIEDDEQSVSVEAHQQDAGRVMISVEDGVLTIEQKTSARDCIFCGSPDPSVEVRVPSLVAIRVDGGNVTLDGLSAASLAIVADSSSVRGSIDTGTLTIEGTSANFSLSGNSGSATIELSRSYLSADMLKIANAAVTVMNDSTADLQVTGTLDISADDDSEVTYDHAPKTVHTDTEEAGAE